MKYTFSLFSALVLSLLLCTVASAQRNLKDIPDPDPELERQTFELAEGLEVNLYAADPLLAKPIQMNFDPQGRLWVASSSVYPQIKPGQEANDKVLILEDTNGDGKADSTKVFAEGLLIPTGLEPGDGGVYVANSTELVHFKDTNGDGKADQKKIVLSGFGTEDTHHILHTLRWGQEGLLYMNQSIYIHSHIETPYGVRRMNGGGIWHFRPETMKLETFMLGLVNTWGHHFDKYGQSFATDGAGGEGINYIFPGWVGITSPGAKRVMHGLNPGSPKYCGLERISGRHFPESWQGNLITNDFRAHRVCRFVLSEDNSGFASRQEKEVIRSSHVAFRPIDVKMGPDGALYIADWYNPIIQHGEVDFRDPRRDHVHGRIWRVTCKDRPLVPKPKLVGASVESLLEQLKSPEQWTRSQAKRVLKERGPKEVLPVLESWIKGLDPADENFEHQRLEAVWTYQTLNEMDNRLLGAVLISPDPRVRAAAVRVMYHWKDFDYGRLNSALEPVAIAVQDSHPRVRLEAVRAASRIPTARAAELAMQALDQQMDGNLDFALWTTMRDLKPIWRPALQRGEISFGGNAEHLAHALKAIDSADVVPLLIEQITAGKVTEDRLESLLATVTALANPNQLAAIYALTADEKRSDVDRASLLTALVDASTQRKIKLTVDFSHLEKLIHSSDPTLQAAALKAAGTWKLEPLRKRVIDVAMNTDKPLNVRASAMQALANLGGETAQITLEVLADDFPELPIRSAAIEALVHMDTQTGAAKAAAVLVKLSAEEDPSSIIKALLARATGPEKLTAALAGKKLNSDSAKISIRAVRSTGGNYPELIAALARAGNLKTGPKKLSPTEMSALLEEIRASGDPAKGETVFRRADLNCLKCHAIGGAGGAVGPDLVSIGGSAQLDYLVESLLEPSKKIKENYHSLIVLTDEGRVLSGIKLRQTDSDLILRNVEDQEIRIPLDEIEEQKEAGSLMPAGLIDELTRAELVNLVRFLSELGKVGDYAIGNARVARRWEVVQATPENNRLLSAGVDEGSAPGMKLQWGPAYSKVSGKLPLSEVPANEIKNAEGQTAPLRIARMEFEVTTPGEFLLNVKTVQGRFSAAQRIFLDEEPLFLSTGGALYRVKLERGRHKLVQYISGEHDQASLRVELLDFPEGTGQAQLVGGK